MPQIEQAYIKTGRVRYVVRDFPLESIHADAFKAAEAAHCAGDGGAFWPMHHRLFAHQTELTREELPGHAQAVGIDVAAFRQCLEKRGDVDADRSEEHTSELQSQSKLVCR